MRFHLFSLSLLLSSLVFSGVPVHAKPTAKTKTVFYTINGKTAAQLDRAMSRRGPSHRGGRAYATLVSVPTITGRPVQKNKRCQLEKFNIEVNFKMTLPRLSSRAKLSPSLNKKWRSFSRFVRTHEEGHRSIWLACMSDAERRIRALRVKSCKTFDRRVQSILDRAWSGCDKRHDAFDRREQKRLRRHPLIVAARNSRVQARSNGRRALRSSRSGRAARRVAPRR